MNHKQVKKPPLKVTAAQARARLRQEGKSFKQFADENNINCGTLYAVLHGHNKGYRGNAHRAAVALGMK